MTDWANVGNFGVAGLIVAGVVYVVVTYINAHKSDTPAPQSPQTRTPMEYKNRSCSDSLQGFLIENTKVTAELLALMRQQHDSDREWVRHNQEAMQGLVIAINNVVTTSKEILDRVKDIDRKG